MGTLLDGDCTLKHVYFNLAAFADFNAELRAEIGNGGGGSPYSE